jgi:hypothetical protein
LPNCTHQPIAHIALKSEQEARTIALNLFWSGWFVLVTRVSMPVRDICIEAHGKWMAVVLTRILLNARVKAKKVVATCTRNMLTQATQTKAGLLVADKVRADAARP